MRNLIVFDLDGMRTENKSALDAKMAALGIDRCDGSGDGIVDQICDQEDNYGTHQVLDSEGQYVGTYQRIIGTHDGQMMLIARDERLGSRNTNNALSEYMPTGNEPVPSDRIVPDSDLVVPDKATSFLAIAQAGISVDGAAIKHDKNKETLLCKPTL